MSEEAFSKEVDEQSGQKSCDVTEKGQQIDHLLAACFIHQITSLFVNFTALNCSLYLNVTSPSESLYLC